MKFALLFPFKILGWAAAGLALGAGWKVGSYLVNQLANDPSVKDFLSSISATDKPAEEPLWKRRFSKIS